MRNCVRTSVLNVLRSGTPRHDLRYYSTYVKKLRLSNSRHIIQDTCSTTTHLKPAPWKDRSLLPRPDNNNTVPRWLRNGSRHYNAHAPVTILVSASLPTHESVVRERLHKLTRWCTFLLSQISTHLVALWYKTAPKGTATSHNHT